MTIKEAVERTATNRKVQPHGERMSEETRLKQGMDGDTFISISSDAQPMTTMSTIIPTITKSSTFTGSFPRPTTEIVGTTRAPSRGRLSTLSSVVRPMPTTATRTVAVTREESRQDVLETARQLIGSMSSTAFMHVPTIISTSRELSPNENEETNQPRVETRIRPCSPPTVSRMMETTTPIRMATAIAQDLIWPGHPDIQGTSLFPQDNDPSTVAAGGLDLEERWKIHHPYDIPGVEDLLWIPLTI